MAKNMRVEEQNLYVPYSRKYHPEGLIDVFFLAKMSSAELTMNKNLFQREKMKSFIISQKDHPSAKLHGHILEFEPTLDLFESAELSLQA